jgi:hypothetical protein
MGAAALALTLVACGGGGDSSPPPTGGGGGTPAPTPTPTPTPTSVAYTKFADLTGNRQFQAGCAGLRSDGQRIDAFGFGRFNNDEKLSIDYDIPGQSWTVAGQSLNGTGFNWQFTQAMIQTNPPANTVYYLKNNADGSAERFYVGNQPIGGTTPEYMRGSLLNYRISGGPPEWRYCVFGVPTTLADTRPATTVSYTTRVSSIGFLGNSSTVAQYDLSESTATISANPTTGEIPVTLQLVGRQFTPTGLSETRVDFGTYSGTATINGTVASFNDALRDSPNRAIQGGNFGGWFFGPQGIEIGMSFSLRANDGAGNVYTATGTVTGRR